MGPSQLFSILVALLCAPAFAALLPPALSVELYARYTADGFQPGDARWADASGLGNDASLGGASSLRTDGAVRRLAARTRLRALTS